ncbi:MAG: PKD domain-containing protein [Bacteroidota bacterium]|nr:PKD domain-containing protein [Bacteroidota bacterium]
MITLAGARGGSATSSTWTTSGTGTFNNSSVLNATYTPTVADVNSGSVILTLTTNDPTGPCSSVSDTMLLTINQAATVNAGVDATICSGTTFTLAGTRGGSATSSTWTTSGTGTFNDVTSLTAIYTASAADITATTVTLTLTTNDPVGTCNAVSDAMVLTINPTATVSAGIDETICSGATFTLSGTRGGSATTSTWSTSGTGIFNDATSLSPTYTPSNSDITSGSIFLILTSNDPPGPCQSVADTLILNINSTATVSAGMDATICSGTTLTLTGTIGGSATTSTWTTTGTGTFDDATSLSAIYTPSAADITATTVTLTLTTNDPVGTCNAVSDAMVLTINPSATVNAGSDTTICQGSTLQLTAIRGGSALISSWVTSGSGLFDDASSLTPIYTPSQTDITAGNVFLIITTNDPSGPCSAASDSITLTINEIAVVDAGADAVICAGNAYALTGIMNGSTTSVLWTTSGSGTFSDASLLSPTYTPSAGDALSGSVTLTISTNDPVGPCDAVSDEMTLLINGTSAAFTYDNTSYCQGVTDPIAVITGTGGGNFSAGAGLVFANSTTGQVDLSASNSGTYTITYTSPGTCFTTNDFIISIIEEDDPSFSYTSGTICQSASNPVANITGTPGGLFSGPTEIIFSNFTTGEIDLMASTAGGPYTITYTTSGTCTQTASIGITIASSFEADFNYSATTFCQASSNPIPAFIYPASAGTFTASPSGLIFVNVNTGEINLVTSAPGTYVITNEIPASGGCPGVVSTDTIIINETATVSAGVNVSICQASTITLSGSMGGSSTAVSWTSSGTGSFDDAALLNATYTPSIADQDSGSVLLTLTSTDPDAGGPCTNASANMILTIDVPAIVSAGPDMVICQGYFVALTGIRSGSASSSVWSTSGTGTFNSTLSLSPIYTPSAADIAAGTVTLTITSDDPVGPCLPVSDDMIVTINKFAFSIAGPAATICAGSLHTLSGSIGGSATGLTWTTFGSGTFDNDTIPNATYTPSAGDILNGSVTLLITTNDPDGTGPCGRGSSATTLTINPAAVVAAGTDTIICSGNTITLAGSQSAEVSSVSWSTSGSGSFDNNTLLNATYTPSATDINSGSVTLTLTSNNPAGPCDAATDSMILQINAAPMANAGADVIICSGTSYQLAGNIGGSAATATWSTSGTGVFDDASTLNATYTPSATDIISGSVVLTLTSDDPDGTGPCSAAMNSMLLTFNLTSNASITYASADVCSGQLNPVPVIAGTTGGAFSETSGNIIFVSTLTGEIDLQASVIGGPYEIIYTSPGTCFGTSTFDLTIHAPGDASFGYATGTFCLNAANPIPVINGTLGGTFSSTDSSVVIDSGTGEIDLVNSVSGTYTISYVTNGTCSDTANVSITITDSPDANFSYNIFYCEGDVNPLPVFASGTSAGVFSASPSGLYFINTSTGEINLSSSTPGTYTITNYIAASGSCDSAYAIKTVTINERARVLPLVHDTICAGSDVLLTVIPMGSTTSITWSTSGSGTFDDVNSLNPVYTPSGSDITTGIINLYIVTNDPDSSGPCAPSGSYMTLTILPVITVDAGSDISVCNNQSSVMLNGVVTGGILSTIWSTSGTGAFTPADTLLNATYNFSNADSLAGNVTLYLTAPTTNSCSVLLDSMSIELTPLNLVSAGNDTIITISNLTVPLNGSINGSAANGIWSTSGTGSFVPDDTTLNAMYVLSSNDSLAGSVMLTLTSTGTCGGSDSLLATVNSNPILVNSGIDQSVCIGNNIALNGIITYASGGEWTTTGDGTFIPDVLSLNAFYIPGSSDSITGTVALILTSTGNGIYTPVSDTTVLSIHSLPQANFNYAATCNQPVSFTDASVIANDSLTGWNWDFGDGNISTLQNPIHNYTSSGSYTVNLTVTSSNGCENSTTQNIGINPVPEALFTFLAGCLNDSTLFTDQSTISTGSINSWNWDFGDATNDSTQHPQHLFLSSGIFNVTLTVVTDSGCVASFTDSVTISPLPIADFSYSGTCTDSTFFTDASSLIGNAITSWSWNFGDGTTSTIQNPVHQYALSGNYITTLIVYSATGCSDTISKNVNINPQPVATFTSGGSCLSELLSFTDNSSITSGSITSWNWDFGDGGFSNIQNPVHQYAVAGTYPVLLTIVSDSGCTAFISQNIFVAAQPAVGFSFTGNCEGTVTFTDSSFVNGDVITNWNWSFGDGATSLLQHPVHLYSTSGNYTVTLIITSASGCMDSLSQNMTINPVPVSDFSASINCTLVNFTDNSSISTGSITSWTWDFGDMNTSQVQHPAHQYTNGGVYLVTLTVSSDSGCTAIFADSVSVSQLPEAAFNTTGNCTNQIFFTDVSVIGSNNIVSWYWNFGDGSNSIIQNPSHTFGNTGSYNVTLIVTTLSGCIDTVIQPVSINPIPVASFGTIVICNTVSFSDNSTISQGTISSWNWDFGDNTASQLAQPIHQYTLPGNYTVNLTVTSDSGCTATYNGSVTINPLPISGFNYVVNCFNEVSFNDTSIVAGGNLVSWNWNLGDGSASTAQNPVHSYSSEGSYGVTLVITDINGCTNQSSATIIINPLINADYAPGGGTHYINEPINFNDQSTGAVSWFWNFGDGYTSNDQFPSHAFSNPGTYNVTLNVINTSGCLDSVSYEFEIIEETIPLPGGTIAVPTAFTPDQDGHNDILYVRGGPFVKMDFRVFNEWGNELFRSTNQSAGWDGTYQGEKQPLGIYIWTLTGTTVTNDSVKMKGDVTILK